ncbi:MAG: hypothetical protein HC763_26240 [Hydrococcus sp. CRU_1_1]|nr:hypothetical protein [Hydrococcus sp. CRU_1_1]
MLVSAKKLLLVCFSAFLGLSTFGCAQTKVSQCQQIIAITKKIAQESQNNRQTTDVKKFFKSPIFLKKQPIAWKN